MPKDANGREYKEVIEPYRNQFGAVYDVAWRTYPSPPDEDKEIREALEIARELDTRIRKLLKARHEAEKLPKEEEHDFDSSDKYMQLYQARDSAIHYLKEALTASPALRGHYWTLHNREKRIRDKQKAEETKEVCDRVTEGLR